MRTQPRNRRRRGATLVEFSLVYSALILILFGIIICGLGVFRYQQLSWLAREGSRWASMHGAQYAKETGLPAATTADVLAQAITPRAVALDPSLLSCTVTWNKSNRTYESNYNSANGTYTYVSNTVTVTLSYQWTPEWAGRTVTLTSSSTVPMAY
jgi:Flp pilus assembly protein TadG